MGGAGDAEHVAEAAQQGVEGLVLRDHRAHGGVCEEVLDGGAVGGADGNFGFAGGEQARQPGVIAWQRAGLVGAIGARAMDVRRFCGGGMGEDVFEAGDHTQQAQMDGVEQGPGQPGLVTAPDECAAQAAHEDGEAERKTNKGGLVGHGRIKA